MADAIVQVPDDSANTGKKVDNESLTVGANTVYRQRTEIAGAAALEIAEVKNAAPTTEYGLVTRNIPSGTQPISGTVTANAGTGTLAVSAASLPLPSGAATETTVAGVKTGTDKIPALGQALAAASVPVVLTAAQVTTLTPLSSVTVSGTVTANAGTGTLAVSAAALPLPSGAATSALQTQPGVDIGDVTVNNAAGASAVNIQDGGNSITMDAPVGTPAFVRLSDGAAAITTLPVSLATLPALVAGTANIGDVDVLTLPALVAGTANIGDVDVLTVPADPFGVNADAASATGSISAKLRFIAATGIPVTSLPALAAGTNNIGDIDVLTVPADPFGVNADAASATGSISAKLRFIAATGIPVTALPAIPTGSNTIGALTANQSVNVNQINSVTPLMGNGASGTGAQRVTIANDSTGQVGIVPLTAGGLSISRVISAASTNATSAKGSAGQVYGWYLSNINVAVRYLKLYNKATAPTVGTDVPVMTIAIPGNTAGAGANVEFTTGIAFSTGIAYALTTGVADADTAAVAANEIVVNLMYK